MIRKILTYLTVLALTGCVHIEQPVQQSEQQLAISSMFVEQVVVDENSTYAFMSLPKDAKGAQYPKLTAQIETFLAARNIHKVSDDAQPSFLIGYLLRKDAEYSDVDLVATFGIDPGLPDLAKQDKGTMLVVILDGQSNALLWRGAAQGFIIDGISEQDRQKRLEKLVSAIFGQFVNK